jgi:hypothetical protein
MRADSDAHRIARPIAEFVGLTATDSVVRYGVMAVSFAILALAAYLFGPGAPLAAAGSLLLAYFLVFFTIYWWFVEEGRKRRVMLGKEPPHPHDSANPDLRDEVVFVCTTLLLLTPLLLQTLNPANLHYAVDPDATGLKALLCAGASADSFCATHTRLFELPAWFLFTLQSFATTVPIVDQVPDLATDTGVRPSDATPSGVQIGLKMMFGGFLLTFVAGMFRKVGGQLDSAIEALAFSPQQAAGMGPIILGRLQNVLARESDKRILQNAIDAVGEIARRYEGVREEIKRLFDANFKERFRDVPMRTHDSDHREELAALTCAFCAMESAPGLEVVRHRVTMSNDYVKTKTLLVRMVAGSLDPRAAIEQLKIMRKDNLSRRLLSAVDREIERLESSLRDEGDDGDQPSPPAPEPEPPPLL